MRSKGILITAFILWALGLQAQDLPSMRWKHRVILLTTDSLENPEYKEMTETLLSDPSGVQARKIVIYTRMGGEVSRGLPAEVWVVSDSRERESIDPKAGFRIQLLGLDGGIKYDAQTAIELSDLWALIDGMPMRRSELRTKGRH